MNYDEAREKKGGGWHWTTMNDDRIRAAGACMNHEPHASKEDAERCFYEYCMSSLVETDHGDSAQRCEVEGCDAWAPKTLGTRGLWKLQIQCWLCDEHRNVDTVRRLYPFTGGYSIIHS